MTPKSARPTSATTMFDTVNARMRKNPSGIIGSGVRLSQTTNSATSTAEAARNDSV